MLELDKILSYGYFPRELPESFSTESFGAVFRSKPTFTWNKKTETKCIVHNLARSGGLRRKLGIPNPISYYELCNNIVQHWSELKPLYQKASLSISSPSIRHNPDKENRAIARKYGLGEIAIFRAKIRSRSRYILQADISHFYASIYTHSIPWAIHGKLKSKEDRISDTLFGNVLDKNVRLAQEGQTMGIPIGPDASLLIAELILTAVDELLCNENIGFGFRYMDDYELGFFSMAEAENALGRLQALLGQYELFLNEKKTRIIDLPQLTEKKAISVLRNFEFGTSPEKQKYDILHYFDLAFEYSRKAPEEYVLNFAISRLFKLNVSQSNQELFQNLLLQCCLSEPGALNFVINILLRQKKEKGVAIREDDLAIVLSEIIKKHAPLGHGSEVAWSIWGLIVLQVKLRDILDIKVLEMNDPVVGILLFHARKLGLVIFDVSYYESLMKPEELYGEQWLLVYEIALKGWLGDKRAVIQDPFFKFLLKNGVSFYNEELAESANAHEPRGWSRDYPFEPDDSESEDEIL